MTPPKARLADIVVRTCSAALILLGAGVLLGWLIHNATLIAVLPGRVSMKANTAIGFACCGFALYLSTFASTAARRWSRSFAAAIFAIGAVSLAEYAFTIDVHLWNVHFDELLFRDATQLIDPGRMALVSAIAFALAGPALGCMHAPRRLRTLSEVLAVLLTSIAFTSIVGYIYGVATLYGSFSNVNTMALHTGLGFLVLGCGILLGEPNSNLVQVLSQDDTGSWLARRFIPVFIVVPILLGFIYSRPAANFAQLRFGMALFALTLVVAGVSGTVILGTSLNRMEGQKRELRRVAMEAAAAVEVSERELRLITDNLPTLISYMDAEGRFLRVNRTYENWFGRPAAQIIGYTASELLGQAYWQATLAAREAAASGITTSVETLYPTVNGPRHAVVTYAPDFADDGTLRGFATLVVDVEEQRRAEARLRQTEKLVAVGHLSSSIAHEINNPIDAVMNILYLARGQTTDPQLSPLLDLADGELKRVAAIANRGLRLNRQSVRPASLLTADLFANVLALVQGRIVNNQIRIEVRDRARNPIQAVEPEIRQVLDNLITNAIDAMTLHGRLTLRSRDATDWLTGTRGVAITVADNGTGIGPLVRSRLFEAFFSTRGIGGTGLGLWICQRIVRQHGGRISLRSSIVPTRHGTVFVVFLPATLSSADAR